MKKLLLSTAILAASTLTASAQDLFRGEAAPDELRASDLMGMRVYASEAAVEGEEFEGVQEGWEDIGEINDMVLSRDGSVEAVLVDVGGFLGIGERQVAVSMDQIRMVSDSATADDASDYFLVINADRAAIEGAPDYGAMGVGAAAGGMAAADATADQATAVEEASAEAAAAGTEPTDEVVTETADADMATDDAAAEAMTESETEMAATADAATDDAATTEMAATDDAAAETTTEVPVETAEADAAAETDEALAGGAVVAEGEARTPMSREGYVALGSDQMTTDNLQGAAVYDANDERVGEVGELLIDEQGMITDVVLDIGGFLGIGEKPVALPMTSLDILQQEGGDDLRIYVSQSREELEAMETYSEAQ